MNQNHAHYIPPNRSVHAGTLMDGRRKAHITVTEIQEGTEISRNHLYLLEDKYHNDPTMAGKPRSGRPAKVDAIMERRIIRAAEKGPFKGSEQLAQEIHIALEPEKQISASTVRRIALKHGLPARMPRHKPPLTSDHMRQRKTFAEMFKDRDMRFWRNVLFCDEVSFQLLPIDRRHRVRRPKGLRNELKYLGKSYVHLGGSLMFRGAFLIMDKEVYYLWKVSLKAIVMRHY